MLPEMKAAAIERVRSTTLLRLTAEIIESVVAMVEEGQYPDTAAASLGVAERTFRGWTQKGREQWERVNLALEQGDDAAEYLTDHDPDGLQMELYLRVYRAEAVAEIDLIRECRVRADAGDYWQAHMTIASRRWPRKWADRKPEGGTERSFEDELAAYQLGRRDQAAIEGGAEEEVVVDGDTVTVRELGP